MGEAIEKGSIEGGTGYIRYEKRLADGRAGVNCGARNGLCLGQQPTALLEKGKGRFSRTFLSRPRQSRSEFDLGTAISTVDSHLRPGHES